MEKTIIRGYEVWKTLSPALVIAGLAVAMVVIAYGVESVAPGVHDTFHDFRHTIGMPCH